ncbi:MAG TPA: hypothetical protein VGD73_25675 [Pseudonocardia sp.]|jgi:hypothetical protein
MVEWQARRLRPTARLVTVLVWMVLAVLVLLTIGTTAGRGRIPATKPLATAVVPAASDTTLVPAAADTASAGRLALLTEVRRELATMRDSNYQHKTDVDTGEGEFNFDCSGFIGYALAHSRPAALKALPVTTSTRPLAKDFERHFRAVAAGSAEGPWRPVGTVSELRPGAVIAWLKPADVKSRNTGHVVVALDKPVRNPARADEWLVKVADSTASRHAQDSRDADTDGLGTGTIGLSVNGAGHPVGYYWRGAVSTVLKHTEISMAEPS